MPPRPDLLPALRNAALFGQIRRQMRQQLTNSQSRARDMRGSDCCQLRITRDLATSGHADVKSSAPLGHCKATVVRRLVARTACPNRRSLIKDNVMTISVPAGFPVRPRPATFIAPALALLILSSGPLFAQDKDPLVAKVNGVEIHQSDLAVAEDEAGQIPPMSPEAKQDYLVQFVADMILVSKAAQDKKFGDSADFKRKLEFARKKLLMEGLLQSVGKEAVTDQAMHKVYDEAIKQIGEEKEVHARHILFRTPAGDEKSGKDAEDKVKAVIVRLKKGEDFAKVAGEVTEDPSGKANGGDLGYFTKDQMVPEFSEAAFKLDAGQI